MSGLGHQAGGPGDERGDALGHRDERIHGQRDDDRHHAFSAGLTWRGLGCHSSMLNPTPVS